MIDTRHSNDSEVADVRVGFHQLTCTLGYQINYFTKGQHLSSLRMLPVLLTAYCPDHIDSKASVVVSKVLTDKLVFQPFKQISDTPTQISQLHFDWHRRKAGAQEFGR